MKIEGHLERGYIANLLRKHASRQRWLASERSMSASRLLLEVEVEYCEARAQELDDLVEPPAVSDKEPSRVNLKRDIDAVDAPKTNGKTEERT